MLECRVCEDVFAVDGEKVPRLLHCGHTVCHSCLLRLKPCATEQQVLLCPFDRQPTSINQNNVSNLKKNFALIELLERLEQSDSEKMLVFERERLHSNQTCDEDEAHVAVLYCTVCASHLCEYCDNIVHSSKTLFATVVSSDKRLVRVIGAWQRGRSIRYSDDAGSEIWSSDKWNPTALFFSVESGFSGNILSFDFLDGNKSSSQV